MVLRQLTSGDSYWLDVQKQYASPGFCLQSSGDRQLKSDNETEVSFYTSQYKDSKASIWGCTGCSPPACTDSALYGDERQIIRERAAVILARLS